MIDNPAAIWSAIAASFAALSSFLVMLIQRRNLLESVRPELILTGWTYSVEGQDGPERAIVAFQTIKNVGRGSAYHISLDAHCPMDDRPTAILATIRLPILGNNEANDLNGQITVWWKNIEPDSRGFKHLAIPLRIYFFDSRGRHYKTQYNLFVVNSLQDTVFVDELGPGVMLTNRTTTSRPGWRLKVRGRLARIPVFGKLFRTPKLK